MRSDLSVSIKSMVSLSGGGVAHTVSDSVTACTVFEPAQVQRYGAHKAPFGRKSTRRHHVEVCSVRCWLRVQEACTAAWLARYMYGFGTLRTVYNDTNACAVLYVKAMIYMCSAMS